MHTTLLTTGLVCVIAAIIGGGLKAFGIEVPAFQSTRRQILLGLFGLVLFSVGSSQPAPDNPPTPQPVTQAAAALPAAAPQAAVPQAATPQAAVPQAAANRFVFRCSFFNDPHIYYVKADDEIVGMAPSGQQVPVGRRLPPSLPNAAWMYHRFDNGADYAVDVNGRIWTPYVQTPIGQVTLLQ